jgi:predicted DNA-binding ribbon-helix-helix protein
MTENKPLYKTRMNRDDNGQFARKEYGEKKIRSMMLSDQAWDTLKKLADSKGVSRTDIIEEFTRQQNSEQQTVLKALNNFIEMELKSYGSNAAQRGKEFSINARTWDAFRKFFKLVDASPSQLELDE